MAQAGHYRTIPDHLHAERLAPRYRVADHGENAVNVYSERQRLALRALAGVFRREAGDYATPGGIAHTLGDGNGWTAAKTLYALERRGLARGRTASLEGADFAGWIMRWRITDAGLELLQTLDRLHELLELCRACDGKVYDRRRYTSRRPPGMCDDCDGTGLRRLTDEPARF